MREPILIGLSAVAFWGVLKWRENRKVIHHFIDLQRSAIGFYFHKSSSCHYPGDRYLVLAGKPPARDEQDLADISAFLLWDWQSLAGIFLSWNWLVNSSRWDLLLMEGSSGRIQWELELVGERFRAPFIIGYGLAQPVLPAAIIYPGLPITRVDRHFPRSGLVSAGAAVDLRVRPGVENTAQIRPAHPAAFFPDHCGLDLVSPLPGPAATSGTIPATARSSWSGWHFLAGWSWVKTLEKRSPWLWRLLLLGGHIHRFLYPMVSQPVLCAVQTYGFLAHGAAAGRYRCSHYFRRVGLRPDLQ